MIEKDDMGLTPVESDPITQVEEGNTPAADLEVFVGDFDYEKNKYVNNGYKWNATTLVEAAKDRPVYDLPLYSIDLGVQPWSLDNMLDFAEHAKRVWECEMEHPIIVDRHGYIVDGWHRVIKAILLKHKTIPAKRLTTMPDPDEFPEKEN
jgi:hypothetical protein